MLTHIVAIMLLGLSITFAQPKKWYAVTGDSMHFTPERASFMYFANSELAARETTILCYVKQGFWWKTPTQVDYRFSVDSIVGRGDKRKIMFSVAHKDSVSNWFWISEHPLVWTPGVTYQPFVWDTLGRTTDSTLKVSHWLTYAQKVWIDNPGAWIIFSDSSNPAITWEEHYPGNPYDWKAMIRLQKILGDPTKNSGLNQQAVLMMSLTQVPNDSLYYTFVGEPSIMINSKDMQKSVNISTRDSVGVTWSYSTMSENGTIYCPFNVYHAGTFYPWVQAIGFDTGTDSWYYRLDSLAEVIFDIGTPDSTGWQPLRQRDTAGLPQPASYVLTAGAHHFIFRGREAGALLGSVRLYREGEK